ncbi:neurobeachin-like isoform X3 [Crassostrea angulata]|uniref:neurobeachin-like isoform X3 n=1 Tax=Magallana angulata TaxID=2784310 RepID=UPI0022B14FD2|nr:neurobeachin-like isoform X3 [Crassostrea angulata]
MSLTATAEEKNGTSTGSTDDILKSTGNDELKFGLLISLLKVDQVPNKDVVDTVLHLLVGGEFDIETNFIIQEPQNILHMLRVFSSCTSTLQAEIWSVFTAMLKKSRRNLQACTEVRLIEHTLNLMNDADDVIADLLVDMLCTLASYSITVRELKMLFSILQAAEGQWKRHAVKLLSVLQVMPQREGPDEFFSFPGKKGSFIALPPIKTWPYQNGWTFTCWLRLDPVTGVTVEREKPYLYCFKTNKGVGYSAHFLGNSLVITTMKVKGKGFQHCVKYDFLPRKWYMVTVVHVYNRWSKSELRCYVNGEIVSGADISWLVSTSDPFDKCFLGASSEGETDHMFCGQMSTVYLFSESLTPQQISAIYYLGPSYKSQFRFDNECGLGTVVVNKRLLYDGKLTSLIVFMYNPIACDGQLCLESSPKGNVPHFVHVQHALMSGEVKSVITHSIYSTLHSLGGVQVVFPLFGQLDMPVSKGDDIPSEVDYTICAKLMSILCNLMESSVTIQQQMMQNRGFLVIGYLLEKANRQHVTPEVLEIFLRLTQYLVALPTGSVILKHLFDHILFNPALWIHASVEVQTKLYCYLATEFINNAQIYNNIRRVSAVLQTMHTLKLYYWVVNPADRSGVVPKGTDGPRPNYDEIVKLRSFMLMYLKQLLMKGPGVQEDELQSILNYLSTLHEDDNLMDVLKLSVELMAEHPMSMVPSFDKKGGIRTVFKLLASPSEELRIQSLKLLGYWLMRSTHKRKSEALGPHNLFSLIGERLMLNESTITMPIYNVLFELLTERMTPETCTKKHNEPESSFRIENSAVLKVVATMIRQSKVGPAVMEVKRCFLSDLTILCNNNRDNRRTVLQMSVWQDWLFSQAYIYPRTEEEQKITDMVMSLFRMLLHHAIKYEFGGWRVWIDTLAILHSKVAYEDFKIHMSKMYDHYVKVRTDDIDPRDRDHHPVSTVSGVSDRVLNKPIPKSTVKVTEIPEESEEAEDSNTNNAGQLTNGDVAGPREEEPKGEVKQFLEDIISDVVKQVESKKPQAEAGEQEVKQQEAKEFERQQEVRESEQAEGRPTVRRSASLDRPRPTEKRQYPTRSQSFREGATKMFSAGPQAPPFRIPEFRWSGLHQKLLSDLLFSIETDVQVWKSNSSRTVIDFVNSSENHVYVVNVTHMISQLADNLITSCGGLLPLLAAATSPNGEVEILEPTQGLSIEQAVSILQRIMNLTDVLVFASSTNFAELEQEKNMPAGGILRQCLRLVCTSAVRNCLECRHRSNFRSPPSTPSASPSSSSLRGSKTYNGTDPIQALIMASHPTERNIVENLNEQVSPIKDFDKLLQDTDVNRLRAVVYRDVEETKQAQFLALAIVYFTSVLMVSKYRDILEPPSLAATPTSHRMSINSPSASTILQNLRPLLEGPQNGSVKSGIQVAKSEHTENGVRSSSEEERSDGEQVPGDLQHKPLDQATYQAIIAADDGGGSVLSEMLSGSRSRYDEILVDPNTQTTETESDSLTHTNTCESESTDNGTTESKQDEEFESGDVTSDGDVSREVIDGEEASLDQSAEESPKVKIKADVRITDTTDEDSTTRSATPGSEDLDKSADSAQLEEGDIEEGDTEEGDTEESEKETPVEETKQEDKEPEGAEEQATAEAEKTEEEKVEDSEEKVEDGEENVEDSENKVENEKEGGTETEERIGDGTEETEPTPAEAKEEAAEENTQQEEQNEQEKGNEEKPSEPKQNGIAQENAPEENPSEAAELPTNVDEERDGKEDEDKKAEANKPIHAISSHATNKDDRPKLERLQMPNRIPETLANLPAVVGEHPESLTERLEKALGSVSPLLREIFVDFAPFLSKTLIGSHGQELLIGGLVTLKQSSSVVELVMLLCSQEWQNSLQKHAGLAFIELVNEGRLLAHATRDHIVRVANEAEFILNRMRAEDVQKHAEFESLCAQTMLDRKEEEKMCDHLIKAAKRRDHTVAIKIREKILNILTNKHGAWGHPEGDSDRDFWRLDIWEDDSRRRRRLIKNPYGSTHPEATLKAALEHGENEDAINQAREAFHAHLSKVKRSQVQPDYTDEELLMEERDIEQDYAGPVALSTSCKLIAPGAAINGTMSITKTEMYFEMDEENEENKKLDAQVLAYVEHIHGKWHFNEIRAIFSRLYLLQNVAIEIFMANRTAVMFAFPDHATVKRVVNALPRVGVGVKYGLTQSRRMSMASGKQLFRLSGMTQKWQRREISNFDYLMYLNTIAGRTYNDLNQYPVYPWVIVNYDTDELDLKQPSNFRDLSKPIGALNPTRREFFQERYNSWEHDQIPPFHYGTHYSTAAFTLNWLIRVEPFSTMFLNLQGGKFDHANRTFSSIAQSWKNCQRDTSDVKELIPEFYFLPEMFINQNRYKFGKQEDGGEVGDVEMPPWAKNPDDFVRINRMALESEFVSCQLHHWIDLIFGYKQRGPEAVRSTNVFYYLTYEGSVNLESMTDLVMKEAIENQIKSFGQTPTQLLAEPHPPRSSLMHLMSERYQENKLRGRKTPMMFSTVQDDVCMIMKFLSNSPVIHIAANTHPAVPNPAVTTITCNHNFAVNKWNTTYQLTNTGLQRRSLGDNFDERIKPTHQSFVTSADNRFIFACGFWDKSFRIFSSESGKILQVVNGHFDVVTCITRSECNLNQDCYIVTGSKDCTAMVWMFTSRNQAIIGDNGSLEHPTPKATLTGHESEVICVAVLAELGLVLSGSKGGACLVHSLNGDLLRSLDPPKGCLSPELIIVSREGFVLVKFDQGHICNFSINGRLLQNVNHRDVVHTMILSRDGQYMMLGGDSGIVEVWRSHDLTLLYTYPPCDSSIKSLALTHDHKFLLAGLGTGCLLVFNIDFNKWHHEFQEKY